MEKIPDIQKYTNSMKKSLLDKSFFLDKIEVSIFVDYGCADGTLLKFIKSVFPSYSYYGYDISEDMIRLAKEDCQGINFCTDFTIIKQQILQSDGHSVLILSSIIHEIYSYCSKIEIAKFWDDVFNSGFDYIVIRDMMVDNTVEKSSDINDFVSVLRESDKARLSEFQNRWGSVENNKNLVHYLLKYRYIENWDREVNENYLPLFRQEFLSMIPNSYEVTFHEHYILPFLKDVVFRDFSIKIKDNTHIKMILERK